MQQQQEQEALLEKSLQPKEGAGISYMNEIIRFAVVIAFILLPLRLFVVKPFIVSGASMDPSFQNGEYLVIDAISYHFDEPERGDVIIFRYPEDPSKFFIKRVIGLPEETVRVNGTRVSITSDSGETTQVLNEPYVLFTQGSQVERLLGPDEYFVMGDNRAASHDSRAWGPLPRTNITGRVWLRLFPLTNAAVNPGQN